MTRWFIGFTLAGVAALLGMTIAYYFILEALI
jgi:hypothetical protein